MLLLIAGCAASAYWFGWPWFQQQWQRFEVLEREVAKAAEPGPDVAAIASQAADQRIQERLSSVESAWQRDLSALSARQTAERAESTRQPWPVGSAVSRSQMDRCWRSIDARGWGRKRYFWFAWQGKGCWWLAMSMPRRHCCATEQITLLRGTGEPEFEASVAIMRNRAALAAVPVVDQVGLYARLSGLIDQVDQLQLEFESQVAVNEAPTQTEGGWWSDVAAGWSAALKKLSGHLIIRRRSNEVL